MKEEAIQRATAGVVLVLAVGYLLTRGSHDENHARAVVDSSPELKKLTAIKKSLGSALPRRKIEIKPAEPEQRAFDPYEEWDTGRILDHFAVPAVKFEGVRMAKALRMIREIYAEHGGKNLTFRIEGRDPGFTLDFETGGSLRAVLELVAGVGGFDLDVGDREVVLRRNLLSDEGLVQARLDPAEFVGTSAGSAPISEDPFGQPVEVEISSPIDLMQGYGIGFEGGAGIEVDPATGEWIVTHTEAQITRVNAAYSALNDPPKLAASQILFTLKSAPDESGAPFDAQTFADAAALQRAGMGLADVQAGVAAMSIVTTDGQRARIEIIREVIYPTGVDEFGAPTDFDVRNVGLSIDVEPILAGLDRVVLVGVVDYTTVGDQKLENLFEDSSKWQVLPLDDAGMPMIHPDDFSSHLTDFEGQLRDGNTSGFLAAKDEGAAVQQFITVRRIGPDGKPLLQAP